jgi:hypothetical protein
MNKSIYWAFALLAGCASAPPVTVGTEHPANPDAPTAALPAPSRTLALLNVPPPPVPEAAHQTHAGHGMPSHAEHMQQGATTTVTAHATTRSAAVYTCPHHPEVTSDKPGTCPKCKMKLVKKEPKP